MAIDDIDVFWVLLCACLVWIMQAGFLCLETGLTRSKNNINVALKNICDNATSIFLFWLVGFSIAFGAPFTAPFAVSGNFYLFQSTDNHLNAFFVFQAVFCSTCCTIVSGAAAERLRFIMYPVLVTIIAGLIYPVAVNAGWGGLLIHNGEGFLVDLGFYDFAGSSIVHSTGGWVALALVIIVGPRIGRFGRDGQVRQIQGSNLTLSSLGVLILWFGWMGFNGGSAYNFSSDIGIILSNTLIAGSASLVITLLIISQRSGSPSAEDLFNGALGGLVGITASANCVSSLEAVLIGAGSALSALLASRLLLRFKIDDVVGAVPVHLAAGIWGTLAVGLFGDLEIIASDLSRLEQIQAQLMGILFIAVWAFGTSYLFISAINRVFPFRVPREDESVGLNISEHGASSELYELIAFMKYQSDTGNMSSDAPTDQFTETGIIGMAYNHVMDTLRIKEERLRESNTLLEAANEELRAYDHLVAHDLKNPLSVIHSYAAMIEADGENHQARQQYVARIRRSSEDALQIIRELLNFARASNEIDQAESIDLQELIYNTKIQLDALIAERKPQFDIQCSKRTLWFNSFALQQVLVNLVSNAIKYTPEDEQPQVTIRSRQEGDYDLVEVEDRGIGIPKEQLTKLFEKHSRLHSANTRRSGYGLGLYHVRKLIRAGGGEIDVHSEPEVGCCFTLRLKCAPPSQAQQDLPEAENG
ncbi:hypothetical protein GCM10011352_17830 [Marinobacterium zhoushanense]|uniref:Ammonium transporter n=1 Tax=Marinobacterium zhoushanense TaxID=1679163 RepID=A0ABQ1KC49_9GAMM|nr:ammonium transporter [Marinobacterium zhoushanense]GGB92205.1 hypothetical protein GCM10011352_17830 [Marinobacterium zhoushanense]